MSSSKLLEGPQLIHVGERKPGDKKFATDEYLFAPPGTIVAPRRRDEKPTLENAARAIVAQGQKLGMLPKGHPDGLLGLMPEGAEGQGVSAGPAAYKSFMKSASPKATSAKKGVTGRPAAKTSPPAFHALQTAEDGAGASPDPLGDALRAILATSQAQGIDVNSAANVLHGGVPATAPAGGTIGQAEGTGAFAGLLQSLLAAAGLTGPDLLTAQLGIMQAMGRIDPRALGITDPSQFRTLLGEGKGMPTVQGRQQDFNESLYGFQRSSPRNGTVAQTGPM